MKIVVNKILPFRGFVAINLFGVIFIREGVVVSDRTLRHEAIHTAQMRELLYVPFYLFYFLEWLVKLLFYGKKAYRNISFEREAYSNENDLGYTAKRPFFAFIKRILK